MMKKIIAFICFVVVFQTTMHAQQAFKDGEKLTYSASYKMSGFLTQLAQVTMETKEVNASGNTLLHFKCRANTYRKFDAFFKIRDLYESYVTKNSLLPLLYRRDIQEGNYVKKMKYVYNQRTKTVKSTQTKRRGDGTDWVQQKNFKITSGAMDVVTTMYYLRNLPIENAKVGDQKTFKVLFDRQETPITIRFVGKENVSVKGMGTKQCYKLQVLTSGDFLKSGTLWLTADANKIPVQARFTIPIGSGMLQLTDASGLAN